MSKKRPYDNKSKGKQSANEPETEYTSKKRLNFEAHHTFEEMNEAKQKAFMQLSMGERFWKGLELYQMFKDQIAKQPEPGSYVLRK